MPARRGLKGSSNIPKQKEEGSWLDGATRRYVATSTPWGTSEVGYTITEGMILYETPSHGGIHLSPKLEEQMPAALKSDSEEGWGGWYEEDVDANKVIVAFPQYFRPQDVVRAKESLKHWDPDAYEAFYHETIPEGQSRIKDEKIAKERNVNNYTTRAAWGDWQEGVPKGKVLVLAQRDSDKSEKYFLVPQSEYKASRTFVIDESRHEAYTGPKP